MISKTVQFNSDETFIAALIPAELKNVCNILRVSDRISAVYCGSNSVKNVRAAKEMLADVFGLNDSRASEFVDSVGEQAVSLLSLFEIDAAHIKPFSRILEQAQQELSRLNITYEMLVLAYEQAKEKSERLAIELKAANDKLRELASRDMIRRGNCRRTS